MSYAFLWAEALLTAILWVTAFIALTAAMKARWIAVLVVFAAVLVPLAPFAAMVFFAAKLKFQLEFRSDWFAYSLSLLLVYLVCAIVLSIVASRPVRTPIVRFGQTWPRARLVLLMLAVAACGALTVWSMDRDARSQGRKLKDESRAMIATASASAVSESNNAASVYEKVFARLAADEKALIAEDSPLEAEPPDENNPAAAELLARYQPVIKLLHEAASMPGCRFQYDEANPRVIARLPNVIIVRVACRLLWLDARQQQARGHLENAIADLNALFRLSRGISATPTILSVLLSGGADRVAMRGLEDVLPAITNKTQLAGLDIGELPSMAQVIQNEQASGLGTFSALFSGRFPSENGVQLEPNSESTRALLEDKLIWSAIRIFLLPDDLAAYREMFRICHWSSEPQSPRDLTGFEARAVAHSGFMTKLLIPSFSSVSRDIARDRLKHAEAALAIALTLYRLDHGNYPESIRSLIPDYLEKWPGRPPGRGYLHFIHKHDKIIIYGDETCEDLSEQERELPFEQVQFHLRAPR